MKKAFAKTSKWCIPPHLWACLYKPLLPTAGVNESEWLEGVTPGTPFMVPFPFFMGSLVQWNWRPPFLGQVVKIRGSVDAGLILLRFA